MKNLPVLTLPALLQQSVEKFAKLPAVGFVDETHLTYLEFENQRRSVTSLLEKLGIQQGDRVALLSANMPHWGITYFAIASMGAIVVPILPDFSVTEIDNVCFILLDQDALLDFYSASSLKQVCETICH